MAMKLGIKDFPKLSGNVRRAEYIEMLNKAIVEINRRADVHDRYVDNSSQYLNKGFLKAYRQLEKSFGTYKIGAKKGQLKENYNNLRLGQLEQMYEDVRVFFKRDIYSRQGKEWKKQRANTAYKHFIGDFSDITDEQDRLESIKDYNQSIRGERDYELKRLYEHRKNYSQEKFERLTELYNTLGKKLVEQYGSAEVQGMFEIIEESDEDINYLDINQIFEEAIDMGLEQEEAVDYVTDRLLELTE